MTGFFSNDVGLERYYCFLSVMVAMAASFAVRSVVLPMKRKNNSDKIPFNVLRSLRISLSDCCWLLPAALGIWIAFHKPDKMSIFENAISACIGVFLFTWPLLIAAIVAAGFSNLLENNRVLSKRGEVFFCCLLVAAIVVEVFYIHGIKDS